MLRVLIVSSWIATVCCAQLVPLGGGGDCQYAWYWYSTEDPIVQDNPRTPESGRLYPERLAWAEAREGNPILLAAGEDPQWATGPSVPYYRWQTARGARPWSRAEVFSRGEVPTTLPSRDNEGLEVFLVWLIDPDPFCKFTSKFKGESDPSYRLNVHGAVSPNGKVKGIVTATLTERFDLCTAANNGVGHRHVVKQGGVQYTSQVGAVITYPPALIGGLQQHVPSLEDPWSKNERFRGGHRESPWVKGTRERMRLEGYVQTQLSATGAPRRGPNRLHTHVYDSDHGALLKFHAFSWAILVPLPLPPSTGSGGITPGFGSGGTTSGPGSGGTTPGSGSAMPDPAPIPSTPATPRPPRDFDVPGGSAPADGGVTGPGSLGPGGPVGPFQDPMYPVLAGS